MAVAGTFVPDDAEMTQTIYHYKPTWKGSGATRDIQILGYNLNFIVAFLTNQGFLAFVAIWYFWFQKCLY